MTARNRLLRLFTTAGVLRVRVCGLCAAVILDAGAEQHRRQHVATEPNRRPGVR